MHGRPLAMLATGLVLVLAASVASANNYDTEIPSSERLRPGQGTHETGFRGARDETLWIFDADFSTETGDNAGWTSWDRSGTIAVENYWHHDDIRTEGFPHLGDSTWWCGTYHDCWRQDRGYGNDWLQILKRDFPEVNASTDPGDELFLDWDQRFAMEHDYDYGYVEISDDSGASWTTLHTVTNPGFAGKPGTSQDWDSPAHGHMSLDLSSYAGLDIALRFRFESDPVYSSEDQGNNPPNNSVQDGAWQLDNITWSTTSGDFWIDDSESGNMGWEHEDVLASGQTGVVWWRGRFGLDFVTGRAYTCDDRSVGTWMYAHVDPFTSTMVDAQSTWLMSPPIDISGAPKLVTHWDQWADMPEPTGDLHDIYVSSNDNYACVTNPGGFVDEEPGSWFADATWYNQVDDWDAFAGNDWLAFYWAAWNDTADASGDHWAGLIMNFQKVGIPSGNAGTTFDYDAWTSFNDWFQDELSDAFLDSARLLVKDDDGVVSVSLVASNDGGSTWQSFDCRKEDPSDPASNWWIAPPPVSLMTPGSEIFYYYESIDGVGTVAIDPEEAPNRTFEMSILPLQATVSTPGILLVDKHGRITPGEKFDLTVGDATERPLLDRASEFYYAEMLSILGYEYEVYDVEVPSGSILSDGPDTVGMKYYDTQIWFTNDFDARTINPPDQSNLISWLNQSSSGKERNLLVTGNDIGYDLMQTGNETLGFYGTWLATEYVENAVGSVLVDSVPGLEDHTGDWSFMTHDDDECIVRGGCPTLNHFDVVEPFSGVVGTEIVADFIRQDATRKPAGVAYTHPTAGYQTVNLGFGMEFMMDGTYDGGSLNYTSEGYYHTGVDDRVDLMQNIMAYFGQTPGGDGTGIVGGGHRNILSQAYPNPFNPTTSIAYSVREAGPVTIRVYNAAGRTVRTILETELEAGASGQVAWDGANDAGERCASGVYFYRIEAPGFATSRKMVMLK